jgi:hypothetical protein
VVKRSKLLLLLAMLGAVIILCAAPASSRSVRADSDILINGGFETGNLSGWTIGGSGGNVEVLQAGDFSPGIAVPEGNCFALLSTGPGEINLSPGSDLDGSGFLDYDSSTLEQNFSLSSQQVPATLGFRWNFLSSDIAGFDDFFVVTLDGINILSGSVPGTSNAPSPFIDVPPLDQFGYTVTSYGLTNDSAFDGGACGFQDFSLVITAAGSHTLQFTVADQEDRFFDSGLLIDAIQITPPSSPPSGSGPSPTPTSTPTPSTTPAPTPTPMPTPTSTPTQTSAPTPSSYATPAPTLTLTPMPTQTITPSPPTPETSPKSSRNWPLIGGIIGGVLLAMSLILVRGFIRRRRGM